MKSETIWACAAVVVVYYWWHLKHPKPIQPGIVGGPVTGTPGRTGPITASPIITGGSVGDPTTSTLTGGGATALMGTRQLPTWANPKAGTGRGFVSAPNVSVGALNKPTGGTAGGLGARLKAQFSSPWTGMGSGLVSPSWPTTRVRAGKRPTRINSGAVQVPSYTAVPASTRGPGGVGTVINFGGAR